MSDRSTRRVFLCQAGGCFAVALATATVAVDLSALPIRAVEGRALVNERGYPIPAADGVNVDHTAQVMLVKATGHLYAFSMVCPHQHAAVRWLDADRRFECTKHHSKYQTDGVYTSGRATRNLDRFPIRRDSATVFVDVSRVLESDKDPAGWGAATVPA